MGARRTGPFGEKRREEESREQEWGGDFGGTREGNWSLSGAREDRITLGDCWETS